MVGATARRHHPNPAEAHRRWRGERSKPGRLGVRDHHTRSLCAESPAQTEQWCCWLCRRRNIFGRTCARGRGMRDAGRWSELRIPGIAAQTRMVSLARIRLVSRKSPRIFKRIICDDVSEFEFHMPSHAVRSLSRVWVTAAPDERYELALAPGGTQGRDVRHRRPPAARLVMNARDGG